MIATGLLIVGRGEVRLEALDAYDRVAARRGELLGQLDGPEAHGVLLAERDEDGAQVALARIGKDVHVARNDSKEK